MMDFINTKTGQIFFNVQLPALIDALDRIAKSVEESNKLKREELNHGNKVDNKNIVR